jgi:hypothetical protein
VLEPQLLSELLADLPEAKPVLDEWTKAFEPIRTAAKAGEPVQAAKLFFELANNQGPGAFDMQPEAFRQMIMDNAAPAFRTSAAHDLLRHVGCPEGPHPRRGGEQTQRYPALINEVVVRCIPGSRLVVIPKAMHLMSSESGGLQRGTLAVPGAAVTCASETLARLSRRGRGANHWIICPHLCVKKPFVISAKFSCVILELRRQSGEFRRDAAERLAILAACYAWRSRGFPLIPCRGARP